MTNFFRKASKYSDLVAAGAVVLVVVMMIIPLPAFILDLAITLNVSVALAIVVATLYMPRAIDFSSFPSLLLLTTLFRLAINVSVTRLILLHGDAGHVVSAFGSFVVGGNVVVGLVIFLILVVIQFVVVTAGAGGSMIVLLRVYSFSVLLERSIGRADWCTSMSTASRIKDAPP